MDLYDVFNSIYEKCKTSRVIGNHELCKDYFLLFIKIITWSRGNLQILDSISKFHIKDYTVDEKILKLYASLLEEFNIISYYTNLKEFGCMFSDRLIFAGIKSKINEGLVLKNQKFYMNKISAVSRVSISPKCNKNYVPLNSSIIKVHGGYIVNARTSNYILTDDGDYIVKDGTGCVNTINYLMLLDTNFGVMSQNPIVDKSICDEYSARPVKGLEDVILFRDDKDNLLFTCTTLDTHPNGVPQISLCKLTNNPDGYGEFIVTNKRPIYLIEEHRPEKNWLPFYTPGKFNFIYSYGPTIIRTISHTPETFNDIGYISSEKTLENVVGLDLNRFRGSAGPLEFDGGYLVVVHEVTWLDNGRARNYVHRFVYMDPRFGIKKLSLPFYFESLSVEFCRSMCNSHNEDNVILTVGIRDRESWLYILEKKYVLSLLINLDEFLI